MRSRVRSEWRLRTRVLELGRRTLVMGVVNITPDSFSDGGRFFDPCNPAVAIAQCLALLDEGADILDLGAESTRPGTQAGSLISSADAGFAPAVSAEEEQARLLPVLKGVLAARPQAIISVDTYKIETARAALIAGAEIVNDVSGFEWDPGIAERLRRGRLRSGADAHARPARGVAHFAAFGFRRIDYLRCARGCRRV